MLCKAASHLHGHSSQRLFLENQDLILRGPIGGGLSESGGKLS